MSEKMKTNSGANRQIDVPILQTTKKYLSEVRESAAMLAPRRLTGVALRRESEESFLCGRLTGCETRRKTSPEFHNRGVSGAYGLNQKGDSSPNQLKLLPARFQI